MAQYFGNYVTDTSNGAIPSSFNGLGDAWRVGVTVDYQIADNLYAKGTVNYTDADDADDVTTGFFRLQRAF
jgi:long-subunit fatty acid transport protein